jgi:hypothetical protein
LHSAAAASVRNPDPEALQRVAERLRGEFDAMTEQAAQDGAFDLTQSDLTRRTSG